jgi:N,N'-diacetylchitobiose transport system permease protein
MPPVDVTDRKYNKKRRQPLPYLLLLPTVVILLVMLGYPVVTMIINSFYKYDRGAYIGFTEPEFVGFGNYTNVLTDSSFWLMLFRSFLFMIVAVLLTMALGVLMSLLMMRLNKGIRLLVSVGLLLAWAMPALAATQVWAWLFDTTYGVVNWVMTRLTGSNWFGHSWLASPLSFFTILGIIIVWQGVPFIAFSLYAGLTQIPTEVLEASQMDGASPVKRFFLIMFPYVRSIFTVMVVLSIIWDLRVFAQVQALQMVGGTADQTSTFGVWIYRTGTGGDFGLSAAAAVIMVFVMLVISFYYVRQTLKEGN